MSSLDFRKCNSFVKFSFTNAETSQPSTHRGEIMLCHAVPRLSLVWFPPFFWLEDLSVFGTIQLWKESAKEVALLFSTFKGVSPQRSIAYLLILLPRPPLRCQIQQCHYTMSFPLKSLPNSDDWWCLFSVSKINSVVNLRGLKHIQCMWHRLDFSRALLVHGEITQCL